MRRIFPIIAILLTGNILLTRCNKPSPNCTDRKRWDVKTLTDAATNNIVFSFSDTTISDLIRISPQITVDGNTPRFGIEFRTYKIQCRIREYKLSSDGDYHVVIEDLNDPSKTMIAEIPDPDCGAVKGSSRINEITTSRKILESYVEATSQIKPGIYIIQGVAFFDQVHGQLGVAPNGIEIHPILGITKK